MKTLALIPARSGSKGIPGKNTRIFWGKPLMAWAIRVGQETCNRTYVTTDDPKVALVAARYGAQILIRPRRLAEDDTPMLPVVQHALEALHDEPEIVVLLQPTQPLRTPRHVREGLALLESPWDSVVSVVRLPEHHAPELVARLDHGALVQVGEGLRRQDTAPAYVRDGTFYITRSEVIRNGTLYGNCRAYEVPERESVTIDTESDWARAEALLAKAVA